MDINKYIHIKKIPNVDQKMTEYFKGIMMSLKKENRHYIS